MHDLTTSAYRPEVDGLRAVAIVPVILFHAGFVGFDRGFLGVDVFFVISGYLITRLLLQERRRTGAISLAAFYERRVRRIVPALVLVTACAAASAWVIATPARMLEIGQSIVAAFTFSANFWFLSHSHYFSTEEQLQPLIHVWSLAVEEQFYLALPLFMILSRRLPERRVVGVLAALALASIVWSERLAATDANAAFYRPDTRAWELLIGALCAFADPGVVRHREPLAGAGVSLVLLSLFALPVPTYPGLLSLPACIGTALIVLAADPGTRVGKALAAPALVHVGLISYSLYLWHQPILAFARIARADTLSLAATAALCALGVGLSEASWRLVERPFRRRGSGSRRFVFACAAICAAALVSFGLGSTATQGYAGRYGDKVSSYFAALGTLDDSNDVRTRAIRMGVCHYRVDMSPPLEEFLANWRCTGSGPGAKVLVVGDSQAADKAAGFALNGVDVGQMTGAACRLTPRLMSAPCRKLFDFVISRQANEAAIKTVVLANRNLAPLTERDIAEAMDYWSRLNAKILWLSEMPEFNALEDHKAQNLLRHGSAMDGAFPVADDAARSNYELLHRLEAGRYKAIDSGKLYCAITAAADACLPYLAEQGWIALPNGHLTAIGARLFARNLLSDATFRSVTGL